MNESLGSELEMRGMKTGEVLSQDLVVFVILVKYKLKLTHVELQKRDVINV